jgi:hypothetical protein
LDRFVHGAHIRKACGNAQEKQMRKCGFVTI